VCVQVNNCRPVVVVSRSGVRISARLHVISAHVLDSNVSGDLMGRGSISLAQVEYLCGMSGGPRATRGSHSYCFDVVCAIGGF
jgi:hypothetical protein